MSPPAGSAPGEPDGDPPDEHVGDDDEHGVVWLPERLLQAGVGVGAAQLQYVVVEEMVDGLASLLAWEWPLVDTKGRLFWHPSAQDHPVELSVPLRRLVHQLYEAGGLRRDPRCGDTFAARVDTTATDDDAPVDDLRAVFPDGVYDLSAEAHQAAKLSYQGALADIRGEAFSQDQAVLIDNQELQLERIVLAAPEEDR
jgi:hypothetical protein